MLIHMNFEKVLDEDSGEMVDTYTSDPSSAIQFNQNMPLDAIKDGFFFNGNDGALYLSTKEKFH